MNHAEISLPTRNCAHLTRSVKINNVGVNGACWIMAVEKRTNKLACLWITEVIHVLVWCAQLNELLLLPKVCVNTQEAQLVTEHNNLIACCNNTKSRYRLITDEKSETSSKCPMLTECPFRAEPCSEDDDCSPDAVCCKSPCGTL
ncbi:hypothetical protein NQ318_004046 [Aromia moschata]|uniref:WAP domain-containing protein n=1 Tax=Aromia moschata TaxID=1265417 RepID=A0AAV8Z838_9CUCU|nr:hypothetical protein NQ318_004046 [Aromia moschata]